MRIENGSVCVCVEFNYKEDLMYLASVQFSSYLPLGD